MTLLGWSPPRRAWLEPVFGLAEAAAAFGFEAGQPGRSPLRLDKLNWLNSQVLQ